MGNGPYDPMEGDADWGYTGYGTGDPKPDGWWDRIAHLMPTIVGTGLTAGLIPGGGSTPAGWTGPIATTSVPSTVGTGGGVGGFFGSIAKFFNSPFGQIATNTVGNLVKGKIDATAQNRATDAQAQAAREALDFEKGVYDKDVADYAPYNALNPQIAGRISELLGRQTAPVTSDGLFSSGRLGAPPSTGPSGTPPMMTINQMRGGSPTSMMQQIGGGERGPSGPLMNTPGQRIGTAPDPAAGNGLVRMQSPDGEMRMVQPQAVAKYEAKGARRVA